MGRRWIARVAGGDRVVSAQSDSREVIEGDGSTMANAFELIALALPGDVAPESLPATVRQFVADCWPGMSRGQLLARARRLSLRPSLRAGSATAPGEIGRFALTLTAGVEIVSLIAHLRRVAQRRASARSRKAATASRPPARDPRQALLF